MTRTHPRTGQFGVVRTPGFAAWVIRLFTRSQVNHAYIYITENMIVEAKPTGAVMSRASIYDGAEKAESNWWFLPGEASDIRRAAERLVGTPYGFLDIVCIGLMLLGLRWGWLINRAQSQKRLICSQLVDRAYRNAGIHLYHDNRPDGLVTPGDLLMYLARGAQPGLEEES